LEEMVGRSKRHFLSKGDVALKRKFYKHLRVIKKGGIVK